MEKYLEALADGAVDTLKLLPFLFVTYLLMELIEHRTSDRTKTVIRRADRFGPLFGGVLGIIPQCGFSAAASSLYSGRVITVGTLLSVFLSTSDEMLPIFLSERVSMALIGRILLIKAVYGVASGFAADFMFRRFNERKIGVGIHGICTSEHCHCEESIVKSALKHTLNIAFFLFLISLALNVLLAGIGTENLQSLVLNRPVVGPLLAGLIGLIPNCAASIVLTQMYLQGAMSGGAMMSGLMVGAGVGLLVLFRTNRNRKENTEITLILYVFGVIGGILTEALRLL